MARHEPVPGSSYWRCAVLLPNTRMSASPPYDAVRAGRASWTRQLTLSVQGGASAQIETLSAPRLLPDRKDASSETFHP